MKYRSPYFVFFMIILTLGIYFLVWVYKVNNEIKKDYDGGPDNIIILILFCIPIVHWMVWIKWLGHVNIYQERLGYKNRVHMLWVGLIGIFIFSPFAAALTQKSLNNN